MSHRVYFLSSELTPLAKVGGLGDVAGALPKAIKSLGADIRVALPKYGVIDTKKFKMRVVAKNISVRLGQGVETVDVEETVIPGSNVPVYLIANKKYFGSGGVYFERTAFASSFAEIERFSFFSAAALAILPSIGFAPEIIHCNDWHTSLVPLLLRLKSRSNSSKTLLTIHNLANQGRARPRDVFKFLGLKGNEDKLLALSRGGDMDFLTLGIMGCDKINTVSPSYAKEILTPAFGEGLERFLRRRRSDLSGILNGIDTTVFSPEKDQAIAARYGIKTLDKKMDNKKELERLCGWLAGDSRPIAGFVARLTEQKGVELILKNIIALKKMGVRLVFLGMGKKKIEDGLRLAANKFPDDVYARLGFDADFAQQIYAGADFFLMPSRFEPCGLGQMISMRYGTIPIAHEVGGIKDTIRDVNAGKGAVTGTGFLFQQYSEAAFLKAIGRALALFSDSAVWRAIMKNAMRQDFSWESSAKKYLELYRQILKSRQN